MFIIQGRKQGSQPSAAAMFQCTPTRRGAVIPINRRVVPRPVVRHTQVLGLLAWAVQTAAEHGILEVVEQTTARSSFLAAVRVAEAFLTREGRQGTTGRQESERSPHELWSTAPRKTPWDFSARPRKQKLGLLQLWTSSQTPQRQQRTPTERKPTLVAVRSEENSCFFDGHRWMLRWAGKMVTQRNLKGWRYIVYLLQHPNAEVHVLDLLALTEAQPLQSRAGLTGVSAAQLATQGLRPTRIPDERTTCDAAARASYRQRLVELQEQEEEAERYNDSFRAAAVRTEIEFLARELADGYGYRTHTRAAGEVTEKARKAVTNRIRDALVKVRQEHPALWQHLFTSLQTGASCSYHPTHPVKWA
jgi:hypothetical protein